MAAVAGKIGPAQLQRLILEAKRRHTPESLDEPEEFYEPDHRHVTIHDEQISFNGTVQLAAVVDYADALDIETALQTTADQLKLAGSTDTLDGRRATALGEIARTQLALTYPDDEEGAEAQAPCRRSSERSERLETPGGSSVR